MKNVTLVMLVGAVVFVVGCANKKPVAGDAKVTDIRAANTPPAPPPMVMPVQPVQQPVQPVISDSSPVAAQPAIASGGAGAIGGNSYTVQKGDTLFKIARARYGDASAVRKIKEANPGLDADHIRAGQRINLP